MPFYCSEPSFFLNQLFITKNLKHLNKGENSIGSSPVPFPSLNTAWLVGVVSLSVGKRDSE